MEQLVEYFNNENNSSIIKLSYSQIKNDVNNILLKLQYSGNMLKTLHKKLKEYRHVDDLQDIQTGRYIRWINLKNPNNLKLTNGGIIIDIKIIDDEIHISCKNSMNFIMQIRLEECVIFQKITDQEHVILSALKYLETKKK